MSKPVNIPAPQGKADMALMLERLAARARAGDIVRIDVVAIKPSPLPTAPSMPADKK